MSFLVPAATTCLLLGAVILFLGIAILRDGGRDRLHRVTALMLFFGGLGALLAGLGLAVRASAPTSTEFFTQFGLQFASVWEFFFPALLLFTLVFPTEHPWLKRFPWIQELIFVPYVFHLALTILAEQSGGNFFLPELAKQADWAGALLTPIRVGLTLIYGAHAVLFSFVNLGYVVLTLTVLSVRSRQLPNPRLAAQTRVVLLGLGTCLVLYSLAVPVPVILAQNQAWERWTTPLLVLALAAGSGSIAYSIIRHRFLDARLLIRRSLIFVGVAGVVATVYVLVVRQLDRFLSGFSALDVRLIEPVFLMIALVLLQPAVNRVEELFNRWLMRDRREGRVLLQDLTRDIVTVLDVPRLGDQLTRGVFESMVVEGAALLARLEPRGEFTRVAQAGFGRVNPELWTAITDRLPALAGAVGPQNLRQIAVHNESERSAELAEVARHVPLALLVPLQHGDELLGALAVGPKATRTRFSAEDQDLLATLGNQAAAAVRNAHLLQESLQRAAMEEELNLARKIQHAYLPSVFPRLPRFELAGVNVPSRQVGGDYYDCVELDGQLLIVVADVVGKGVPAALMMSMLQASLRTMASERMSLSEIVERLNRLILHSELSGKFATCFLARLDSDTLRLDYSNAGHNPPLLLPLEGEARWLMDGGLLLGAFDDPRPAEASVQLHPGDRLVLYTDGITEAAAPGGEFFGEERLEALLRGLPADLDADQLVERVMSEVRGFCGDGDPGDDMTVVVARVPCPAVVAS